MSPHPNMSHPLSIALIGANGRMGQAVLACAERQPGQYHVAQKFLRGDSFHQGFEPSDVIIDFSLADATTEVIEAAVQFQKPLVIGSTGHSSTQIETIRHAATQIPIVYAANFSEGVNMLFWLTRKAAEILGNQVDYEIIESHHRLKCDAPSGTAKRLAEVISEVQNLDYASAARHGRTGDVGARTQNEIGIHAIRGGDIAGEHTVMMAGLGGRLELTYRASNRDTYAIGALHAAQWLKTKKGPDLKAHAGLYDMEDVLNLRK